MTPLGWALGGWLACQGGQPAVHQAEAPQVGVVDVARARRALADAGVTELRWGYTPYLGTEGEEEGWAPVFAELGEALGVPIYTVHLDSYGDAERELVEGRIDVATMSPYGYVQARKLEPGLTVFASHVARGTPTYGVYLIAGRDSPVERLEDVRGRRIAYVDKRSTSGWLFPAARLLSEGIDPVDDVQAAFLGSHGAVFDAVATGQVDVGAVYDHALTLNRASHPQGHTVRVVAKAPRIPFDAYVHRAGLEPAVGEAPAGLLGRLSSRSAEGRRILRGTPSVNGFFPVDDGHYDVLREVERTVEERREPG